MQNLLSRPIGKWTPDADEVGAPEGVLLRADNTVPDETGARALRAGSAPLYEGFQEQRVESLYGTEIDGVHRHDRGYEPDAKKRDEDRQQ